MTFARLTLQRFGPFAAMIAGGLLAAAAGASAAGNLSFQPSDSAARPQAPQLVIARTNDLRSAW